MKYNGWANRETWLVNLYFGDSFYEYVEYDPENDTVQDVAAQYEEYVAEHINEELSGLSTFLTDLLDLSPIDWCELADSLVSDLKQELDFQES